MLKPTFTTILMFSASFIFAQNLVINSSFEAKNLRRGYGELEKANAWTDANNGSADLFDKNKSTAKNTNNGIPYNYMGYQPSGDGQNYAGIVAYYDDGENRGNSFLGKLFNHRDGYKRYTEYIQGEFREVMEAGRVYQISFRINLSDKSGRAVSCLGALITDERVKQQDNSFIEKTPQFITHRIISDTTEWVVLSGAYIAKGGEKFITIGCFKDAEFIVQKVVADNQNDSRKAYYYISEVSVVPYLSPKSNIESIARGVDYIELMNIEFATGSSEITPKFYNDLDEVAGWMVKFPDYRFFVAGYTDGQGPSAVNDIISKERANQVKAYLVSKGVIDRNILTEGFGSSDPIDKKLKSRRNRRVEIYLYSTDNTSQL